MDGERARFELRVGLGRLEERFIRGFDELDELTVRAVAGDF